MSYRGRKGLQIMNHGSLLTLCMLVLLSGCAEQSSDSSADARHTKQVVKIQDMEIVVNGQEEGTLIEMFHGDGVDGSTSNGMTIRANNNSSYSMSFTCLRTRGVKPMFYLSLEVDRSFVSDEVQVTIRLGNEPPVTVQWQTRGELKWWASPSQETEIVSWVSRIVAAQNRKIEVWIKETAPTEGSDTYAMRFENRGIELDSVRQFLHSESGCGYPQLARHPGQGS